MFESGATGSRTSSTCIAISFSSSTVLYFRLLWNSCIIRDCAIGIPSPGVTQALLVLKEGRISDALALVISTSKTLTEWLQ